MILEMAGTGSRQQRQAFLYQLTQLDEPAARDKLWTMARGSSGYSQLQALDALAQANPNDPELTAMLVDLVNNGRNDEMSTAAYSLARAGSPEARDALMAALSGGDTQRASAAVGALGQMLADPDLAGAVAQAARSTDPQLRQAALGQLVYNGLPEGMKLAEEMLKGGDSAAASQAMQVLMSSQTPDARRLVREATGQQDAQVRALAASALAASTDEASTQSLIALSRDSEAQVRNAALNSLGQVGSEAAMGALLDTARAGETESRQAAINALAYTDDGRASALIAELIKSGDPGHRHDRDLRVARRRPRGRPGAARGAGQPARAGPQRGRPSSCARAAAA